ncbi:pyridoxal phosphate-dependent transferase [Dunaliella salina]|uniref:Pyridoxal phosphate-dependent transferase n=1 Tax=Dunaliella salina TaxID=3046 RepID=A0ABQ7H0Q0_DUNSA|nr:pyridoxal phosphate-dependent transferase [Dunaliella salina]|eukprot:KAF5840409.1 pyridoxal phosphate-dependent transferase [Dunaliella salina]
MSVKAPRFQIGQRKRSEAPLHLLRRHTRSTTSTAASGKMPPLSERGERARKPMLSYGAAFQKARQRPWTPEDPEGAIICSVAENKLNASMLHERISGLQPPLSCLTYPASYRGTPEARSAVARMAQRTFMKGIEVDPANLVIQVGAGAILDTLFWLICEPNDAVLIPGPIYPAFMNDLTVRAEAHPSIFQLDEHLGNVAGQLEAASAAEAKQGRAVRAILLTNPNNPCGTIYKPDTVMEIVKWCLKNNVHVVSDEVYANSVFGRDTPEFVSAEVLVRTEASNLPPEYVERIPELLHIVFGMSKDFCASGLRVGVLHTRNAAIIQAMDNLSYFHCCPAYTQYVVTQALADDAFIDSFIARNRQLLRNSYELLTGAMDKAGIPYTPACAAMFLWIDLGAWLAKPTWEEENLLWEAMMNEAKVLFTPGQACKAARPGFFRVCWAWVPPEALPIAVSRIKPLLDARKEMTGN